MGHDIAKNLFVGGTLVSAIDGRRKINKNSSTGHTGVNYHKVTGKYRAYIYFKRKQYYLGLYDNLEDAITARKTAEEKLYGDFLKWYTEAYPEQWEKIKEKETKNDRKDI